MSRGRRAAISLLLACGLAEATPAAADATPHRPPAASPSPPAAARAVASDSLVVGERERLLVLAPHPDDETIGAAGLIQRVLERDGSVRVVLMTAGDAYVEAVIHETRSPRPRPADFVAFGERRIRESRAAMRELDHGRIRLLPLGFPDGGLAPLLGAHWSRRDAERSPTTGATDPPYDAEAVDPDVPYDGDDLRRELAGVVADFRPTLIALPDPLDRHPDHHATGVFGLLAIADWLSREGIGTPPAATASPPSSAAPAPTTHAARAGDALRHAATGPAADGPMPRILAYLVHWPGWPPGATAAGAPPAPDPRPPLRLPADFPAHGIERVGLDLTPRERAAKAAAMARYATQQAVMPEMLSAFVTAGEPFLRLGRDDVRAASATAPGARP